MTLSLSEAEVVARNLGKFKRLQQQLEDTMLVTPALAPTKEAEIAAIVAEIKANEHHIRRTDYIAAVQPLKDQLRDLIAKNDDIIASNNVLTKTAQDDYKTAQASIDAQIDTLEAQAKKYLYNLGTKLD